MGVLYVSGIARPYTVGRDPGADLVLNAPFVSRRHLRFVPATCDVAVLEVTGTNGAVVNGKKVNKGYRGHVGRGDLIRIGDTGIVWIGSAPRCDKNFIHTAPRPSFCDITPVEVEGPPLRKIPEKPSVMLAAGPALTMAIPILLGAGRSVAILSSIFAAIWAALNVTGRIRKQKGEEKRRRNTYMSYIAQCEETIKKRTYEIKKSLDTIYPVVGKLLADGGDPFLLWNAPAGENGAVTARIGIGTVDSPFDIVIPKERFAGVDDSLKDLPAELKKKYEKLYSSPVTVKIGPGDLVGYVLASEADRRMLAALIMQLAVSYSPDDLAIRTKLEKETARYFMWIRWLPHWRDDEEEIQESCQSILVTDDAGSAYETVSSQGMAVLARPLQRDFPAGAAKIINRDARLKKGSYDMIGPKLCYSYAGQISCLWGYRGSCSSIPALVPFGRLLDRNIGHCTDEEREDIVCRTILKTYENADITQNIGAPIGLGEGGEKVILDLHEKAMGPHGLVAGTTGSGKSELLTTVILSLACRYPPDQLAFFLIDYKGGGMSNLFETLPHLIGNISNLSKAQSRRAMTALGSENRRRQEIFAHVGVNNINDYTRLYTLGRVKEPLPHVLIIVDEFAELRREEPEFMDRLISVSQVGRSLGMHLILATQKPAGVIDDKIRGNSRFRIALRLVDRADSMDMLHRPDASAIKECGRAYLQVGNDEVFECFQSGYAMGPVSSGEEIHIFSDFLLEEEEKAEGGGPHVQAKKEAETWYELLMRAVTLADKAANTKKPAKLWLPEIPADITDESAYAVFDDPYAQRYIRAVYEPKNTGHILIAGRSGSGKSELIRTLIERARLTASVYIIDYGGGRLKDMADGSSCGGYIADDDPRDIRRMTLFICDELAGRRRRMNAGGPSEDAMILVLDNISEIKKAADPEVSDQILRILTLGKSAGVYVIASSISSPGTKEEKLFDSILYMGYGDPYTVAALIGTSAREIPDIADLPGRGVGMADGRVLEFQAVKTAPVTDRPPPSCIKAKPYPHVPHAPTLEDLMERASNESLGEGEIPVGYELISGRLYTIPSGRIRCVLVCGRPYSGKHTLLFNICVAAARYGAKCAYADTYESLLALIKEGEGGLILIHSFMQILDDFYKKERTWEEENDLISCMENLPEGQLSAGPLIIGIMENEAAIRYSGRKLYDAITRRPYGISLGGGLDENRILDYSYLPYSIMQKSHPRGHATVARFDEKSFFGDVIFPCTICVDNSQTL